VPKKVFYAIFGCWTGIQRASKCELCVLLVRSSPGGWGGGATKGLASCKQRPDGAV